MAEQMYAVVTTAVGVIENLEVFPSFEEALQTKEAIEKDTAKKAEIMEASVPIINHKQLTLADL